MEAEGARGEAYQQPPLPVEAARARSDMARVGVLLELGSPSSEAGGAWRGVAEEAGEVLADVPSDGSSGDGEWLSPLDGEGMG